MWVSIHRRSAARRSSRSGRRERGQSFPHEQSVDSAIRSRPSRPDASSPARARPTYGCRGRCKRGEPFFGGVQGHGLILREARPPSFARPPRLGRLAFVDLEHGINDISRPDGVRRLGLAGLPPRAGESAIADCTRSALSPRRELLLPCSAHKIPCCASKNSLLRVLGNLCASH